MVQYIDMLALLYASGNQTQIIIGVANVDPNTRDFANLQKWAGDRSCIVWWYVLRRVCCGHIYPARKNINIKHLQFVLIKHELSSMRLDVRLRILSRQIVIE